MTPMPRKRTQYLSDVRASPMLPNVLDDVKAALEGLRTGAHYAAAELYERYERAMERQGREPVHAVPFGRMLIQYGAIRKAKWDRERQQMVKGWII